LFQIIEQYPCTLERDYLTSKQWGSLFTDNILSNGENSNIDQQQMNTLWGFVIQKYADISVPHLEHITGTCRLAPVRLFCCYCCKLSLVMTVLLKLNSVEYFFSVDISLFLLCQNIISDQMIICVLLYIFFWYKNINIFIMYRNWLLNLIVWKAVFVYSKS